MPRQLEFPSPCIELPIFLDGQLKLPRGAIQARGALLANAKWEQNQEIKIAFLSDVSNDLCERMRALLSQWQQLVNLRLNVIEDPRDAQVRIGLDPGMNSSEIGTMALRRRWPQPTMLISRRDIERIDEEYGEARLNSVILHEFGHVLGAVHEHQRPDAPIKWNERVVIDALAAWGWTEESVRRWYFDRYAQSSLNGNAYDSCSIMHYWVAPGWADGFTGHANFVISPDDKVCMSEAYPRS